MAQRDEEALLRTSVDNERNTGNLSPRRSRSTSSTPPWHQTATDSLPPKTIILGLWPHADDDQVKYYTQGYEALYPTAKILLLHSSKTSAKHIERVLTSLIDNEKQSLRQLRQPDTLVHLFGHDAAAHVCRLLRSYRLRTAQSLDVKSVILDSVPVAIAPNYQTIRKSPTRWLAFLWICITSIFWGIGSVLTRWFSEPHCTQVREDWHDPKLLPATVRKCYIFPEKDLMFAWGSPTLEDESCQRQTFRVRRNSIDHQQQWTNNQERYWLGVENAWQG